jgi:transposase
MLTTQPERAQATIVVAGVDTHKDTHHVAVLDLAGRALADAPFPASAAGYRRLLEFVAGHGVIDKIGVELTGSYGAALTRYLIAEGVPVVEVNTTDKATRARRGKDDAIDAVAAAQKALAGMASATPKDTTGATEAIRLLTAVRDLAVKQRTQAMNQIHAHLVTAPEQLREPLRAMPRATLLQTLRSLRPDRARLADPVQAAKVALKALADRIRVLDQEIAHADADLTGLVQATAPTLLARPGIGVHTAARFLITAAANVDRLHGDAAFARLCGAAPVPVSSGKTHRMRLHRGGDRQANRALHMIVIGRIKTDARTQTYLAKKLAQGHSKRDAIRALKRYLCREVLHALRADLMLP